MATPTYVPPAYQSWVSAAAAGTGLPASVVAAQIEAESGFNPRATSPVGAAGIAQFMPATYASVGGTGSPYVAANQLQPYITYMSQLLQRFNGNVHDALAAYNAGPGNIGAGAGYASSILSAAGLARTATIPGAAAGAGGGATAPAAAGAGGAAAAAPSPGAGAGGTAVSSVASSVQQAIDAMSPGIGLGSFLAGIINSADTAWTDLISPAMALIPGALAIMTDVLKMLEWVVNPTNWVRIGAAIIGTIALIGGLKMVTSAA